MTLPKTLKNKILNGGSITYEEALGLLETNREELYNSAREITRSMCNDEFDSCSIVNVKSGRCPENCKWCAQSAHYATGCDVHDVITTEECLAAAKHNSDKGVKRFSFVASGRATTGRSLERICELAKEVKKATGIFTCASLGLLDGDGLQKLWDSGVRRYHCNLEAAPSFFPQLCSTHTLDDKIRTIRIAQQIGFEICSGGIIGMGETAEQRVEFGWKLREISPVSIPINILCPIPGTPLANAKPLSEDEILTTMAIYRFIHPTLQLRFAGGRTKLSRKAQLTALEIGINGGIVGDLLTTLGSQIDQDRQMVAEAGYRF